MIGERGCRCVTLFETRLRERASEDEGGANTLIQWEYGVRFYWRFSAPPDILLQPNLGTRSDFVLEAKVGAAIRKQILRSSRPKI